MDGSAGAATSHERFDRYLALVIEWEGPPTNDPDDPGGPTTYGISSRYNPEFDGTLAGARGIYLHKHWVPIHGDELPAPLALVVFDASVIPGLGWAAEALQEILRVEGDGVIGPDTLAAAKHSGWLTVLHFTAARIAEFERRTRTYPRRIKYLKGWRKRCLLAYREAVKLEGAAA